MPTTERHARAGGRRSQRWLLLWLGAGLLLLAAALLPSAQTARGKVAAPPAATPGSPVQQQAGALALANSAVQSRLAGHRAEVLAVLPLGAQLTPDSLACALSDCRLVEIYDFDSNATVSAIVDLRANVVRDVLYQPRVHPQPNARLSALAIQVALASTEFIHELGRVPAASELAPMPSGVPGTACASAHLCLAVTAPQGQSLVWAVVDVTDGTLVAVLRTPALGGDSGPVSLAPAEPSPCPAPGSVTRGGWRLNYETTSSDGFRVYDAAYRGVPVLTSAKIVEWHTDYGSSGFVDEPGCGNYIAPHGPTLVNDLMSGPEVVGFEIVQDFRMGNWGAICNYRYEQHDQFYNDGRFRIVGESFGKGCSMSGIYRPLMRLDLGLAGAGGDGFDVWNGAAWHTLTTENWLTQTAPYTTAGFKWRWRDQGGRAYFIEPGQGQFGDGGRGDFAFLYATQHHAAEGDTDLGTIGFCCSDDAQQGPDQFLNGESIAAQDIVLWYVPQMQTEVGDGVNYCWTVSGEPTPETYPCAAGPMFVPQLTADFVDDAPALPAVPIIFTNTSAGQGALTIAWSFGDGGELTTTVNPTHAYAAAGLYTVTLSVTDTVSSQSVARAVAVGYAPQAGFNFALSPTISTTVILTNTSTGSPALAYQWDFGDSTSSTAAAPNHTYAQPGLYTVVLTATNFISSSTVSRSVIVPPLRYYWPLVLR